MCLEYVQMNFSYKGRGVDTHDSKCTIASAIDTIVSAKALLSIVFHL